ncbi:MAG: methanol dehydrogenase, partial [Myxococcales bacterium]
MTLPAGAAARALARLAPLVLALLLLVPSTALALAVPPLRAHVNDTADMLSPEAEAALEQRLTTYEQRTTQQFALLTVDTLEGDALEDFSIRVVEQWKLGQKGKDNGLLLLIVKSDRKLRIEAGYGLEGEITDAFSSRVIRNVLTPQLRAGQAGQGVDQAFTLLMKQASGEAVPESALAPPRRTRERGGSSPLGALVLLFLLVPFVLPLLLGRGRGGRRGPAAAGARTERAETRARA